MWHQGEGAARAGARDGRPGGTQHGADASFEGDGAPRPESDGSPGPLLPADLVPELPGKRDPLTARLVRALAGHPEGLRKPDLLVLFYPDYPRASNLRRGSLEVCLNKLLQRARSRYAPYGVVIAFDRASRRWRVKFLQRHRAD